MDAIKYKRGDMHPVTGRIFWAYKSKIMAHGRRYTWEVWVTREERARRTGLCARNVKSWNARHPEQRRAIKRANYYSHPDHSRALLKRSYQKHKAVRLADMKLYQREHHDELRIKRRARIRARYKSDPLFRLKRLVARRIRLFLSGRQFIKERSTEAMIGCTFEQLKAYLEALFLPGMSWENQHLWQIDHEKPLASAKTKEEVIALCHFTNLQPLWERDNNSKGAKLAAA